MSDNTMRLVVDLTYNADIMHGDCEDSIEWFKGILHGDNLHLAEFGDLGDIIGPVKVIAELTSSEAAYGEAKGGKDE